MNVPSGYTALDLIGFTDRGDYSSLANYVKNDLVHSGGKVWLCLVDDTTNITPAVGANWKIWIDEAAYLSGLADTTITSPIDGQVLRYDIATNKWVNASVDSSPTQSSTNLVQSGGVYTQLANKANTSDLATVATSGSYNDLSNKPSLAAVATSGSYNDLSNKPTLGTAAAKDSTNAVTQNSTDLVESGAVYTEIDTVKQALTTQFNELGAKNLCCNTNKTMVLSGVTFTKKSDGSVELSGVATSDIFYDIKPNTEDVLGLKAGESYILSGCPSDVPTGCFLYYNQTVSGTVHTSYDEGSGYTFTALSGITSDSVRIFIKSGSNFTTHKTFYPMIRPTSIEDNTYVPYTMTNRELTNKVTKALNRTGGCAVFMASASGTTDEYGVLDITDIVGGSNVTIFGCLSNTYFATGTNSLMRLIKVTSSTTVSPASNETISNLKFYYIYQDI